MSTSRKIQKVQEVDRHPSKFVRRREIQDSKKRHHHDASEDRHEEKHRLTEEVGRTLREGMEAFIRGILR